MARLYSPTIHDAANAEKHIIENELGSSSTDARKVPGAPTKKTRSILAGAFPNRQTVES